MVGVLFLRCLNTGLWFRGTRGQERRNLGAPEAARPPENRKGTPKLLYNNFQEILKNNNKKREG